MQAGPAPIKPLKPNYRIPSILFIKPGKPAGARNPIHAPYKARKTNPWHAGARNLIHAPYRDIKVNLQLAGATNPIYALQSDRKVKLQPSGATGGKNPIHDLN